ncbi:MAG: TonB-dependent receptor [Comamonas sp.]
MSTSSSRRRVRAATRPRLLAIAAQAALLGLCATAQAQTSTENTEDAPAATGVTLGTVTVKAKAEAPTLGNVTTVDGAELSNATSMADAIRNRPLISAPGSVAGHGNLWDGSGTNGYNIRGVEGNRIGLDTDGIELPAAAPQPDAGNASGTAIGRDYIDPEVYRQIRIASGTPAAGSAEGSGLGGRVSFLSKTPEDYLIGGKTTYLSLKAGYNGADRSWNEAVTGAARLGDTLQALVVYSRRDGHEGENYGDVPTSESTDFRSNALLTRFVWTPNDSNKFGLTADLYDRKDNRQLSSTAFTNASGGNSYPYGASQTSTTRRDRISLDHAFRASPGFALFDSIKTTVYYQDSEKSDYTVAKNSTASYTRYIDTGLYTKTAGLNSEAVKQLSDADTLHYGLSLNWTNERRPWTETRISTSTGSVVSGYPTSSDRMAETDTTKLALYARDEHRFELAGHQATFTPSLRAEYIHSSPGDLSNYSSTAVGTIKSESTAFLAPSLNLTYALTPGFNAYAQYSHGVRVPTAGERTGIYDPGRGYAILGNPDLKQETSNTLELGTKGEVAPGITLDASAFYSRYKNFIDYKQTTSSLYTLAYVMTNLANVDIYGAELTSRIDWGRYLPEARGYSSTLGLGIAHGSSQDTDGNKGGVNSVAPARVSLTLAYDDPAQRFGLSFTTTAVKAKQPGDDVTRGYTASNSYSRVPGYTRFDLGGYWNVRKNLRIDLALNNLSDKKYWDYSSVRMLTSSTLFASSTAAGRNAAISATLTF